MGRKIPGRKHHGVRDPEKQRIERFKRIKDKINAPPANPDEQQVPKTLQRLIDLKTRAKNGDFQRKKAPKEPRKHMFERRPRETDKQFLYRVNREVAAVKHEAAFEQKFRVEIQRNEQGEIEGVKKRDYDPLELMIKQIKKDKREKKKKAQEEKLTKSQKRRVKILEKKNKRMEGAVDRLSGFEKFKDEVKFGERADAPPTLPTPRKANSEVPRPGKKDLLLKRVLKNDVIDRKAKRKELPHALRRQLETQQKEVIEAYRSLKKHK